MSLDISLQINTSATPVIHNFKRQLSFIIRKTDKLENAITVVQDFLRSLAKIMHNNIPAEQ